MDLRFRICHVAHGSFFICHLGYQLHLQQRYLASCFVVILYQEFIESTMTLKYTLNGKSTNSVSMRNYVKVILFARNDHSSLTIFTLCSFSHEQVKRTGKETADTKTQACLVD
jgi:hypothetical protein